MNTPGVEHNFCPLCGFCGNFNTKREHKFWHSLWFKHTGGLVKSLALHHHAKPLPGSPTNTTLRMTPTHPTKDEILRDIAVAMELATHGNYPEELVLTRMGYSLSQALDTYATAKVEEERERLAGEIENVFELAPTILHIEETLTSAMNKEYISKERTRSAIRSLLQPPPRQTK